MRGEKVLRKVRSGIDHARSRGFEYVFRLRADAWIEAFTLPPNWRIDNPGPAAFFQVDTPSGEYDT